MSRAADILSVIDGDIAIVIISNPAKLNALTLSMWQSLRETVDRLSARDDVRCLVVRGAGNAAFAAGADIAEFATVRHDFETGKRYHTEYVAGALRALAACRHPIVAMIHGPAVGGGLEIASQCDLRIAGRSARFGVPINRLGFPIAYEELSAVLPICGNANAREILIEGRVWDAVEAKQKGLVTRLVEDDALEAEAFASARRIACGAPFAARWHRAAIRRLMRRGAPLTSREIDGNFRYFATEDFRIGYDAFMQKRKPDFRGR
jgi:enoyl-CoA hydratase